MEDVSRRRFLGLAGLVTATATASACGGGTTTGSGQNVIEWWDHQNQLEPAKQEIFEKFATTKGGVPVQYTYNNPARLGQTLQLAKQSKQLPDIHSNAGLELPIPQLIEGGWVAPMDLNEQAMSRLKGSLIEGVHIFDGKVYSFPIFDYHVYRSVTWFNTDLVRKAGLDPDAPPETYDEFRQAAAKAQRANEGTYGWIWNVGMPPRLAEQVNDWAQAAGFEGGDGMLYRTGEYAYHSEPYLRVLEFLLSLQKDKLLTPGAQSWLDDVARSRWTAGLATYYFDGPWCPGVALKDAPQFGETLGVAPILVPEAGTAPRTYHPQQGGEYWLSPTTEHRAAANQLLSDYFTTFDYSVQVADTMSQPPRDLEAVDESKAHPAYKKLIGWFEEQVRLAPNPSVRNPALAKVFAELTPVKPDLGDIVQGAFSGDVTDVAAALRELSDKSSAERERAVAVAKRAGAEVDLDDWAFPDWKPDADYSDDMY